MIGVQQDPPGAKASIEGPIQVRQFETRQPVERRRGKRCVVPTRGHRQRPRVAAKICIHPGQTAVNIAEAAGADSEEDGVEVDGHRACLGEAGQQSLGDRSRPTSQVQTPGPAAHEDLEPVEENGEPLFALGQQVGLLGVPSGAPLPSDGPGPRASPGSHGVGHRPVGSGRAFRRRSRGRPTLSDRPSGTAGDPSTFARGWDAHHGPSGAALGPSFGNVQIPCFEPEHEGFPVRIGEEEKVVAGCLGVKVDAGTSGEPNPLDVRPLLVADQENERTAGTRVFELDVDLAGRRLESHLKSNCRNPLEYQVLR